MHSIEQRKEEENRTANRNREQYNKERELCKSTPDQQKNVFHMKLGGANVKSPEPEEHHFVTL